MEEDKATQDLRKFKETMEKEDSNSSQDAGVDSKDSAALNDKNHPAPEVIYNTHKFLYTLYHNGQVRGHSITFTNRSGEEETIEIESIEIGASPISARFFDITGKRHVIPFLRVHKVYRAGELVWEGEKNNKDVKIIKGV